LSDCELGGLVEFTFDQIGQRGGRKDTPTVHHIDGNHENNDPANWAWIHSSCHGKHHGRLRANNLGREYFVRGGRATKGVSKSILGRENISRGSRRYQATHRRTCSICGYKSTPQAVGAHQKKTGHIGHADFEVLG
jgi:hypothetical protein